MAIKWKNTPAEGDGAPSAAQTNRGRLRAVTGFLAFALGVSLLLGNLIPLAGNLSTRNGRQWLSDCFQEDYQDTQQFRSHISGWLEWLIRCGLDGRGSAGYWYDYGWYDMDLLENDENLLYAVYRGDTLRGSNTSLDLRTGALPDRYNFLLHFDGEKVTITKDGYALDIYGDGVYREDSQWYVPGYWNFTTDESVQQVEVYLAALQEPQIFVKARYGDDGYQQYNQLYWLQGNLQSERRAFCRQAALIGAGVLLIAVYIFLRRDKRRADQAIATVTGRVWLEGKLLLLLVLAVLLFPRGLDLGWAWAEATDMASDGSLTITQVLEENGWLLTQWLTQLTGSAGNLVALFWAVYLLLVNDWRYNRRPWRRSIGALISAKGLRQPMAKRLSRSAGLGTLGALVLAGVSLILLLLCAGCSWGVSPAVVGALCAIVLCPAAVLVLLLLRLARLGRDLDALTGQIAAVRGGDLDHPLDLGDGHDLSQAADDLNHIQQGLQHAVEEQTRSERMKVELVTNVSHDLKTPLTSIISYAELLEQEQLEPPAGEYVAILTEKAQRLKDMVQDVFEVSKAASGQLPVKPERLDFGKLLRQTLADMAQAIDGSGLTLRTDLPEGAVPIVADGTRLYRVFQNLLGNALKYSLPGSRVYLTLTAEDGTATAAVRNTSAQELRPGADYTARFVRGDESRTDGGSGLGLSIAQSFTEACGGTLVVETQADLFTVLVRFPIDME